MTPGINAMKNKDFWFYLQTFKIILFIKYTLRRRQLSEIYNEFSLNVNILVLLEIFNCIPPLHGYRQKTNEC